MSETAEYLDLLLYIIIYYIIIFTLYYIKQGKSVPLHAIKSSIAPLMLNLVLMSQPLYP
jgi:hypothetical protein